MENLLRVMLILASAGLLILAGVHIGSAEQVPREQQRYRATVSIETADGGVCFEAQAKWTGNSELPRVETLGEVECGE